MNKSLVEIQILWEQETDNYLVKAATIDLQNYAPEVQEIIINEVQKRGLEGVDFKKPSIAKEIATEVVPRDFQENLLVGYTSNNSFVNKLLSPFIIILSASCGALGMLLAHGLRSLFYTEANPPEEQIIKKNVKLN